MTNRFAMNANTSMESKSLMMCMNMGANMMHRSAVWNTGAIFGKRGQNTMMIDTDSLPVGYYAVGTDKKFYAITLPIHMKPAKTISLKTGETHYPTNGDRVRAMTNEELANLFYMYNSPWCTPKDSMCRYIELDESPCDQCMIEWLRQEAK